MSDYFGKKIKEIRINNNLTQKEFADIFGYKDETVIDGIENGKVEMSVDNIAVLTFEEDECIFKNIFSNSNWKCY